MTTQRPSQPAGQQESPTQAPEGDLVGGGDAHQQPSPTVRPGPGAKGEEESAVTAPIPASAATRRLSQQDEEEEHEEEGGRRSRARRAGQGPDSAQEKDVFASFALGREGASNRPKPTGARRATAAAAPSSARVLESFGFQRVPAAAAVSGGDPADAATTEERQQQQEEEEAMEELPAADPVGDQEAATQGTAGCQQVEGLQPPAALTPARRPLSPVLVDVSPSKRPRVEEEEKEAPERHQGEEAPAADPPVVRTDAGQAEDPAPAHVSSIPVDWSEFARSFRDTCDAERARRSQQHTQQARQDGPSFRDATLDASG